MSNPKKWINVYPQGTKEGDQEQKFFIALARHPKYDFRSVSALSKESGLNENRVEEIIQKYYDKGMIFQNPKNEDQWGYWERCTELLNADDTSISKQDKDDRIDEASADGIWYGAVNGNKPNENVVVCDWTVHPNSRQMRPLQVLNSLLDYIRLSIQHHSHCICTPASKLLRRAAYSQ